MPTKTATTGNRRLKIEEHGEGGKGRFKPKIRLVGRWLERAGFMPGNHVHIVCVTPGVLELRSTDNSHQAG